MGFETGGTSHDAHDGPDDREDEDDDEYEEAGGVNRLLGFMFGNVDNSGDLDVDYLDEEAKEHLAAVADKLGPSLTDIDLSVKTPHTPDDSAEQDYDEKAEDAVDFEDIEEKYEGPEVQEATEEDFLLPRKDYFSKDIIISNLGNTIYDDENYDEDDDAEEKHDVADHNEVKAILSAGEKIDEDALSGDAFGKELESDILAADTIDSEEEPPEDMEKTSIGSDPTPLPILCMEDGMVILHFSKILGLYEPLKKTRKKDCKYRVPKGKYKTTSTEEIVEKDEEAFLKEPCLNISCVKESLVTQDCVLASTDDYLGLGQFGQFV